MSSGELAFGEASSSCEAVLGRETVLDVGPVSDIMLVEDETTGIMTPLNQPRATKDMRNVNGEFYAK